MIPRLKLPASHFRAGIVAGMLLSAGAALALLVTSFFFLKSESIELSGPETSIVPCNRSTVWRREHGFFPGCSGMSQAGPYQAEMRFNSEGLRDEEYPAHPPRGALRILLLGSSNVLGVGIPENSTMDRHLERFLSAKLKRKVEVVNAAVNGYCSWQSAIQARQLLSRYNPQLVLYFFLPRTCALIDAVWNSRIVFENGDAVAIDRSLLGHQTRFAFVNSWAFAEPRRFKVLHTLHEQLRRLLLVWRVKLFPGPAQLLLEPTWRAFRYLGEKSERAGTKFAFFYSVDQQERPEERFLDQFLHAVVDYQITNFFTRLTPKMPTLRGEIAEEMKNSPVPAVLLKDFSYRNFQISGNTHLRPEGQEELARQLARELETRKDLLESALPAK